MVKQVVVVRDDLDLPTGKLASQVAHASLEAALQADQGLLDSWRDDGAKKVVVRCPDMESLSSLNDQCQALGIPCHLVRDAGHTVVPRGTVTALGVGPGRDSDIDDVTGGLELL